MRFSVSIIVFLVCLILLPLQVIMLENSLCFGAAGGGCSNPSLLQNIIIFTTPFTIIVGVIAPIFSLIELLIKKYIDIENIRDNSRNFLIRLFLKDLTISFIIIILFIFSIFMQNTFFFKFLIFF